ncbi:hypothetical protein SAMN05216464_10865 [Mucilaginibacter pineti]|uniref:Uncharacterized protein n=1 Tax=Mucilaginibacter pineti TaxID=1391627 RepID=A0A1G7EK51_9SPHI|nr:hypothetical protein SAMN05216464_10865 [Mucilaginibacter pineti]
MIKRLSFLFLVFTLSAKAQNPATMPADSTLSLHEKSFETLWLTFNSMMTRYLEPL